MKKIILSLLLLINTSYIYAQNTAINTNITISSTIEKSCIVSTQSGSFVNLDYFSPSNTFNSHSHIRNNYATTPIFIQCTPGTIINFKGLGQNTSNKNGYQMQHLKDSTSYIVINPYFDLSPANSEPNFNALFRGQLDRNFIASGAKQNWTMYWFAFDYRTNRFPGLKAPIAGEYLLNMHITLEY